jgi:signal transduction histidine kinase
MDFRMGRPAVPILGRPLGSRDWLLLDCLAATALACAYAAGAAGMAARLPTALAVVVAAAGAVPVAFRRCRPVGALAAAVGLNAAATVIGVDRDPAVAVAAVSYLVAVRLPRGRSAVCLAVALVGTFGAGGIRQLTDPALPLPLALDVAAARAGVITACWALGTAARLRRRYAVQAARDLARRAVAEERLRIARELHDVVAHRMALITVKAGVTGYLIDSQPQAAADALRLIEGTGREALGELRRMLDVLRADDGMPPPEDGGDTGQHAPLPGLPDLPSLTAFARQAGVQAELRVTGDREVPAPIGTLAYRIAQEAVTNVIKHARCPHCDIRIDLGEHGVSVEVTDEGSGTGADDRAGLAPGHHGLAGLRERVLLQGGTLVAGPRRNGGYRVSARLPLPPLDRLPADQLPLGQLPLEAGTGQ